MKKVLFLCNGNSARSQMAEALLNAKAKDRFIAFSAGIDPAETVNLLAVETMAKMEIDISGARPKPYQTYENDHFDLIITLCDKGKEQCISHIGRPIYAHWGLPDPAEFKGSESRKLSQCEGVAKQLTIRINLLLSLPEDKLNRISLETNEIEDYSCDSN